MSSSRGGYANFDRERNLRAGAAKERFATVAKNEGHHVDPGANLALVKIVYPNSLAAQNEAGARQRGSDYWSRRSRY